MAKESEKGGDFPMAAEDIIFVLTKEDVLECWSEVVIAAIDFALKS